jgi:hypothetical protein
MVRTVDECIRRLELLAAAWRTRASELDRYSPAGVALRECASDLADLADWLAEETTP